MNNYKNNNEYVRIINDIINNPEFNKIKNIEHHGTTRYDHSIKVSYISYKIAKLLNLSYVEVARGGLLHDFFLSNENRTNFERITSTFVHPKKAVKKSKEIFEITEIEKDIIKCHMFPINISIPKYAESWIVNGVDKFIGSYEFIKKYKYKLSYAINLYLLFILNNFH